MVDQIAKSGVQVELNAAVTAEQLSGYDAVITACGAAPGLPMGFNGSVAPEVWMPMDVFGHEQELGQRVVVVGGGEIGLETGLYLADNHHAVTVISRRKHFPCDWHALKATRDYMEAEESFTYLTECNTTEIGSNYVIYTAPDGTDHRIDCDSVVFSGGRTSRTSEAMTFAGATPEFYVVGDNRKPASVKEAVYSGYTAAMSL